MTVYKWSESARTENLIRDTSHLWYTTGHDTPGAHRPVSTADDEPIRLTWQLDILQDPSHDGHPCCRIVTLDRAPTRFQGRVLVEPSDDMTTSAAAE